MKVKGLFTLGLEVQLCLLAAAILVGTWVYGWTVRDAYVRLYEAYRDGNAFADLMSEVSTIPEDAMGSLVSSTNPPNQLIVFKALQALGLEAVDQTPDKLRDTNDVHHLLYRRLVEIRAGEDALRLLPASDSTGKRPLRAIPTVEVVVHLTQFQRQQEKVAAPEVRTQTADVLAALLANQPGAPAGLHDAMERKGEEQSQAWVKLQRRVGVYLPLTRGITFGRQSAPPDAEILRLLYRRMGLELVYNQLTRLNKLPADDKPWEQFLAMDRFAAALLARLDSSAMVKVARSDLAYFQGYEQLAMWVCFFWMLGMLAARFVLRSLPVWESDWIEERIVACVRNQKVPGKLTPAQRTRMIANYLNRLARLDSDRRKWPAAAAGVGRSALLVTRLASIRYNIARLLAPCGAVSALLKVCEHDLTHFPTAPHPEAMADVCKRVRIADQRSRWVLNWCARALPAIGFIGTVRGIAGALSKADLMVLAQTPTSQAAAISEVSGTLAIAFTTTFIALMMGLLTSLLSDRQAIRELEITDKIEEQLERVLVP